MFDTTMVGWDGSAESRAAAEWAFSRSGDRPVLLAQVAGRDVSEAEVFAADSPAARARIRLDEDADALRRDHPEATVHTSLLTGDRLQALAAATTPDTLLVIGHRPRKTGLRWSFTARLAGSVHGALTVVPVTGGAGEGIVVGVDASMQALAALEAAAAEAERSGEEVTLIHAWQAPSLVEGESAYEDEYLEEAARMREELLQDLVLWAASRHPDVGFRAGIATGSAPRVLREAAQVASLLVVGNRPRSLGARLFLGSVAGGLLMDPACPVMVVNAAVDAEGAGSPQRERRSSV